ncbi:MAG: hypothetical protein EZS28_025383, partial [Streblomastix strix]
MPKQGDQRICRCYKCLEQAHPDLMHLIIGTYRSLNIRDLNITYKGPKTEFVFIVNEGGVLTVKNAVIDVPVTEEETDEYVGYVKL